MRVKYRFRADDDDGRRGGSFDDLDQEGSGREDPSGRYDSPGDERPDTDASNADEGQSRDGHKLSEAGGKDAAGADGPDKGKADLDKIDDSYSGSQWGGSGGGPSAASEGLKDVAGEGLQHGMGAGGIAGVTGSIGAAAAGAVRVLANVLHISPRAATILATVLAVTLPVAGGVAVGAGFMANNYNEEIFWIDEDECEDYIAQAAKEMKNADGSRTEIPETIQAGGEGGGKTYRVGYMATWEYDANGIGFGGDTPNQKVVDLYNAKGGYKTSNGFDRIKGLNDIFILALGQGPFKAEGAEELNVGDLVTVEFDDGTTINAIIGDHKGRYGVDNPYDKSCWNDIHTGQCRSGPDTTCGWGHIEGDEVGVLEFWGFESGGNPMTGLLQAETGGSMQRCTAITVHGMCQEFAEFAGISTSGALVSAMNLKANSNKKASEALEECGVEKKNTEASDFASALVLSAYSQKVYWDGGAHPGTKVYDDVWNNIPQITGYMQYRSCCATVGLAAIWSGIEFTMGGPAEQGDMAEEGIATGEWERLKGKNGEDHTPSGMSLDECVDYFGFKPGTILATDDEGHVLAYAGEEAVQNGYKNGLKGTDGDVGEPEEGAAFVSGSTGVSGASSTRDSDPGNGRPSGIHTGQESGNYRVYHYIGKYPKADETRQAANFKSIAKGGSNSSSAGTNCECEDPCQEEFGDDSESSGNSSNLISENGSWSERTATVGGVTYNYMLYEGNPGQKGAPLILSLHGSGECGTSVSNLANSSSLAAAIGRGYKPACNVLAPVCPGGDWDPTSLKALLDLVVGETDSDRTKISITGVSLGGWGTWKMLSQYPNFFSAAAPVAGTVGGCDTGSISTRIKSLVGENDGLGTDNESVINSMKGRGVDAEYTLVPGKDHSGMCNIYEDSTYNPVPWLLSGSNSHSGVSGGSSSSSGSGSSSGGSSSSGSRSGNSGKMDTSKLGANAKIMANTLKKSMNFSNAQLAGIIANSLFESYGVWEKPGDPIDVRYDEFEYVQGSAGGAWGGGCFGFIKGGGFDNPDGGLEALAASMGKPYTDPDPQLEYVKRFWDQSWIGWPPDDTVGTWVAKYGNSLQEELRPYLSLKATKESFMAEKDPEVCCLIFQAGWERGPANGDIRIKQRMACAKYIYELLGKDVKDPCEDKKKKVKGLDVVVETARLFVGKPYSMANHGDYKNFNSEATDCSGLVGWAYWHALQKDTGCPACDGFAAGVLAGGSEGTCLGEFERVTKYEDLVAGDVLLHCLEPLGAGTGGGGDHAMIFVEDNGGSAHVIEEGGLSSGCTETESGRFEPGDVGENADWNYCCHLKEEFQEGEPTPECRAALKAKGFNF